MIFFKSPIRHLGIAMRNVWCVWCFSPTLSSLYRCSDVQFHKSHKASDKSGNAPFSNRNVHTQLWGNRFITCRCHYGQRFVLCFCIQCPVVCLYIFINIYVINVYVCSVVCLYLWVFCCVLVYVVCVNSVLKSNWDSRHISLCSVWAYTWCE